MSLNSTMIRVIFQTLDNKRDKGLAEPRGVVRFTDIPYGPVRKYQVLDVYRPENMKGKLPVIISLHGGAWVYGDKDRYRYYCMSLVQYGFAVVNFSYRLAPKFKYPAPLEDAAAVFEWVQNNAEQYGFDVGNIFAVGDSAGAHMLGMYCCFADSAEYVKTVGLSAVPKVFPKAVALNCGVYRVQRSTKKDLLMRLMADYLPHKGTDDELWQISTIEHMTPCFPPSYVMTAVGDFLIEQAAPMAKKLKELGVPAEYHCYGDPEHPLGHVFHLNMRSDDAGKCNEAECAFFRKFIDERGEVE